MLGDEAAIFEVTGSSAIAKSKALIRQAADRARRWPTLPAPDRRAMLHALVARIDVRQEVVDIAVRLSVLADIVKSGPDFKGPSVPADTPTRMLSVAAQVKRTGMETRLLVQGAIGSTHRVPDRSLLRLIGQAHRFHDMVMIGQGKTITELAKAAGVTPSWFTRVLRLSFLAPEISKAILQGCQPVTLTAKTLMLQGKLAPAWSRQRVQLGLT